MLFALNAPTNFQIKAHLSPDNPSKPYVTLSWEDNADDESGYKLFRDGYLLAYLPANSHSYQDDTVLAGTTYTYQLYATNHTKDEVYTDKNIYKPDEKIVVSFRHLSDANEWIGIYPVGTPDEDIDKARWHHIDNKTIGNVTYGEFDEGTYEVRLFTEDNTLKTATSFRVEATPKKKKLILAQGGDWLPSMADNMIQRHDEIMKLPFDGYTIVGNSYTNKVMEPTYLQKSDIMAELEGLAGLYEGKDMFLSVWIKFPGDFWDEERWNQINSNFATIASVAKDLGFKGIIFDDEAYSDIARKMINFRFPKLSEIALNPDAYAQWEIDGANFTNNDTMDEFAYRNLTYDFKTHIERVITLYENIMQSMVETFPAIQVLVYHGPIRAHDHSFDRDRYGNHFLIDGSLARENEFIGAIFTGLKRGIGESATVHDMGEMYKLRTNEHFARFYQWRKYDMVKDIYNDDLDPSFQWRIPLKDRTSWSDRVQAGYMVFNKVESTYTPIFDVSNTTTMGDIRVALNLALTHSDEYAIYYCHDQEWLMPGYKEHPFVENSWLEMIRSITP